LGNRSTVVLTGALAGGLIGVALLAFFAGRFAMGGIGLTSGGDAQVAVTSGALYLATVVVSLIGGVAVAVIAYGISSESGDEATRFELGHILPFGLVAAAAIGYGTLRAGIGFAGSAEAGVTTVSFAPLSISVLVSGLITGGLVAWVVSTLASKSVVGLSGEAAPASTAAMLRAATRAVSGPMLAIIVIAALAIALAQLLLAAEGVAVIAIFGGAAALILLGAAGAAYLGGPKDNETA